ncbi:hypothetical protein [Patulibacter minatonensis]|uniref:hypothetical protein n=1 Tax=Patulibacter minatonensis TaxID=298163 RepID=UPI00047B374F|nr:hypothetical protein [Patulibacter minatonensis]
MPFAAGARVVAALGGLGELRGTVLREARDDEPGTPPGPADAPRVYVVEWTLEDGSTVTNTAAEAVLRSAG